MLSVALIIELYIARNNLKYSYKDSLQYLEKDTNWDSKSFEAWQNVLPEDLEDQIRI